MDTSRLQNTQPDLANLYREEAYTDLKVAQIRVLRPVLPTGADDPARTPQFFASTTVMTEMGALPVEGPVDATTLEEAFNKFPDAVQTALDRMIRRAQEMQLEESKRIVVPRGPSPLGGRKPSGGKGDLII